MTGPCPGTTVGASSAIIASQAATQLAIGPAHTIGVQPMNSRSPANNTPASGTCTTESAAVCAGPRFSRCTSPAADLDGEPVVERLVGVAQCDAAEVEGAEPFSRVWRRDRTEVGGLRHHQHLGRHPVGDFLGGARARRSLAPRRPAVGCRACGRRWSG